MASSSTLGTLGCSGGGSSSGNCTSSCPSAEKVFLLEAQVSSLRQQMSVLVVEMGLTHQWIRDTSGAQIINTESTHYRSVHGSEPSFEMQAIQKSLEVTVTLTVTEDPVDATRRTPNAEESTVTATSTSTITTSRRSGTKKAGPKSSTLTKGGSMTMNQVPVVILQRLTTPPVSSSSASTSTTSGEMGRRRSRSGRKKRFQCQQCLQSFSRPCDRRVHERIHTGEKPFSCRFCSESFSHSSSRIIHERRRHTGEKPFKCGIAECSKSFVSASDKKSHERTHTGDTPYGCEYCDQQFTTRKGLGNHIRTHIGEKPYACAHPGCEEAFHESRLLRRHRLRRHGQYPGSN